MTETAFQLAVGTTKERWKWLEEKQTDELLQNNRSRQYPGPFGPEVAAALTSTADNKEGEVNRPELDNFGLAMLGGGRVFGAAHLFDYPWESLGNSQVVDVGGGVGSLSSPSLSNGRTR